MQQSLSASTHRDIRPELLQLHSLQSSATDSTAAQDPTAGVSDLPIPSVPLLCILPKADGSEPCSRQGTAKVTNGAFMAATTIDWASFRQERKGIKNYLLD